ncbi:MAG: TlpA family protein disulfide reductase [Desulfobacterales bacterium]|nr:TlpA family protein disulfide reductase [Desulfobacterales bacterium]
MLPVFRLGLLLGLYLLVCPSLQAGMLGDDAPELQVREWIQGGPIKLKAESGKMIYVIEFWQTECPHCLESLPYLSTLQEQYNQDDVVFIGITSEDTATVRAFLEKNKDAAYALAADDDDKTYDQFMGAFDVSGVPHVFVIGRQGRILWEGHPMGNLDEALQQIVSGNYDLKEAQNIARARKLLTAYVYLSTETGEKDLARQVGERVFAYGRNDPEMLEKLLRFIITSKTIKQPDLELASRVAKRACDVTGETDLTVLELSAIALHRMGAEEAALAYWAKAKRLKGEGRGDNPQ